MLYTYLMIGFVFLTVLNIAQWQRNPGKMIVTRNGETLTITSKKYDKFSIFNYLIGIITWPYILCVVIIMLYRIDMKIGLDWRIINYLVRGVDTSIER